VSTPSVLPLGLTAPAPAASAPGHVGWVTWLEEHTAPDWRPAEWQPQAWPFTGNPDEPRTSVSVCLTVACPALVSPANGYRALCKGAKKRLPLSDEEFARTFQPVRRTARVGERRLACSVTRDGQRCVREIHCNGCSNHYAQFNGYVKRHDLARWRAVATPYRWHAAWSRPASCPPSILMACAGTTSRSSVPTGARSQLRPWTSGLSASSPTWPPTSSAL
jgi:hypothetical protein